MTASRETLNYRRDALKAYKRAGNKFLVRRAYSFWDLDNGNTSHCPSCWNEGYSNSTDPNCSICFGTGFDGGYNEPEVVWGAIDYNISSDPQNTEQGSVDVYGMTIKFAYPPFINDGDLVAPIISDEPFVIGQVMEVDGGVQTKTLVGWSSNNKNGYVNPTDNIVGQSAKLVFTHLDDIRGESDFWYYNGQYPSMGEQMNRAQSGEE